MATSLTLENDSSLAQGYLKVNGSTAATITTTGISANLTGNVTGNVTGNLTGNVTGSLTAGGSLTLATAQTASGTSVDFTGIPSWAKRITVMLNGVSTSGSSIYIVRLGTISGFVSSGYNAASWYSGQAGSYTTDTTSFPITVSNYTGPSNQIFGQMIISSLGNNSWTENGSIWNTLNTTSAWLSGAVNLGGTLDRVRITTVNGTDTFDSGTINISYEG